MMDKVALLYFRCWGILFFQALTEELAVKCPKCNTKRVPCRNNHFNWPDYVKLMESQDGWLISTRIWQENYFIESRFTAKFTDALKFRMMSKYANMLEDVCFIRFFSLI